MKTSKAFTKRLKITRRGKLIARRPGQNHFNAKENRSGHMDRQRTQVISLTSKVRQRYIGTAAHNAR
ncbi:MAG: hypothetical protein KGJ34_01935 [Patescibacteria group bacterium]|nr:hypothetical protein [Patescibacteria group bacterium]